MNYHDDFRSQGPGTRAYDPVDDHRSIRSAGSRNAGSSVSEVGVVTPAQAYARAVKTGEPYDRTLHYTIERRQPERKKEFNPQFLPSQLGDLGSPGERGPSFAQRLYASALNNKSSALPTSNIPVLSPIKHTSPALPTSGGNQASSDVPHRKTSFSTSLFDTSADVSQPFNPSDLYHNVVAVHGFQSEGSTSLEVHATRPRSLFPVLQIPSSPPVTRPSYPATSYGSSQTFALHRSQTVSTEAQSYSTSTVSTHEHSGPHGIFVETHQDSDPPTFANEVILSPLEQQPASPPSFSPPPFEEHAQLSNLSEEAVADAAPVVMEPPPVVSGEENQLDGFLQPPPEVNHEEIPLYSLIDDQLPPPAFDDLQATSASEASAERSPVVHPETSPQEVTEVPSFPSPPPPQSPPPFSHGSTTCAPGKAPAYAPLEKTSYSVGTSKIIPRDAKIPLSFITTQRPDPSSSDPPFVVPNDFQWRNQPPSMSPPTSPSSAAPHSGAIIPSMMHHRFNSRPLSVLSSHSQDSQSRSTSCDPLAIHNMTSSSPLINYRTKPTAKQSGQPFLPPLAMQSDSRPQESSNTVGQERHDSRSSVNVAENNDAIDALTRSMADMMGGPSSDTHSLAYENLSSGRQLRTPFGNRRDIPVVLASHPSGTPKIMDSLNQEAYRPEAERLAQDACRRPTHAEIRGRVGYGIQGLNSENPSLITNILTSRHSPCAIPSPGPIPPGYSHDAIQTESVRIVGGGLTFNQLGETVVQSSSAPSYSNRPHIPSVLPSRSFPYPLQPSHHFIDRDIHGPVSPSGSVPLQQQGIRSPENLDPMKRGSHVFPPPPPPPIALQPWKVSQTPQTSLYSQDSAKAQFGPGTGAQALNSNDLARKFAHDALLGSSAAPAYAFHGTNQR